MADIKCNGCEGKGWIVVADKPFKCPVCEGSGEKQAKPPVYIPTFVPYYPPIQIPYHDPYPMYPTVPNTPWYGQPIITCTTGDKIDLTGSITCGGGGEWYASNLAGEYHNSN